ncbi:ArsR/SmtB family transcription factor [Ornithinimicrobium cryptoxanthini]|uniref:ArsR/SmtB family transcription factor n=1 Tax=Ornithinimicrobium cryptoxanthini TaxID=2934161 RepID=UPI0021185814|nr:metalloregulator ArsR/SmtB family transcription factor [Ornithinimicrobium cryptoxanthini]
MNIFAAIADPVRRSLLEQLAREGPTRVVDLTRGRGISRPAVSRHLRVLGDAGVVRAIDQGRERHFELVTDALAEVSDWTATLTAASASAPQPPVAEHHLDALGLEVRRTVRERGTQPGTRHTAASSTATGEIA